MTPSSILRLSIPGKLKRFPFKVAGQRTGPFTNHLYQVFILILKPAQRSGSERGGYLPGVRQQIWGLNPGLKSDTGLSLPTVPEPSGLLCHVLASRCRRPMAADWKPDSVPRKREQFQEILAGASGKPGVKGKKAKWYQRMFSSTQRGGGQG